MIHSAFTNKTIIQRILILTSLFVAMLFIVIKVGFYVGWLKWIFVVVLVMYYTNNLHYYFDGSFILNPTELIESNRKGTTVIKRIAWNDVQQMVVRKKDERIIDVKVIRKNNNFSIFLTQGLENEKEVFDFIIAKGKEFGVLKEKVIS